MYFVVLETHFISSFRHFDKGENYYYFIVKHDTEPMFHFIPSTKNDLVLLTSIQAWTVSKATYDLKDLNVLFLIMSSLSFLLTCRFSLKH